MSETGTSLPFTTAHATTALRPEADIERQSAGLMLCRPSALHAVTARELDWVIVRENSEGEYAGVGGRVHRGLREIGRASCRERV